MHPAHSFHIPVMGIGFTIDTPIKVAHLGIDSVISLVDDILIEKIRKMYCEQQGFEYQEIKDSDQDYRAKRITAYLNLVHDLVYDQVDYIKSCKPDNLAYLKYYTEVLPKDAQIHQELKNVHWCDDNFDRIKKTVIKHLKVGSIDVNIMTKVDKENYIKNELLPSMYNDAHAALRGFAHSKLSSSVVLSAGMNPKLFAYIENFKDFYPDERGNIKKKIILKVSDYRSAIIQGKFLAKKGLWVSEYRIESGLNCGGHAFATDGFLMGPILQQFKENKGNLISETYSILVKSLHHKNAIVPRTVLPIKISAQGGVGTAEEHQFLIDHYQIDSVGWGSPFLLVPEATTVDDATITKLSEAKEKDLYLSNISPLGVPFHNLKGNTKDEEKERLIAKNRPGSSCPKKFVALNKDYTDKGICTASRQYQNLKINDLKQRDLPKQEYLSLYHKIIEKSCTCVGLGTSALLKYNLDTKKEGIGVSVCPGPNMAYFSKVLSLKEMVDYIYGISKNISRADRPNMFIKELQVYIQYIKDKIEAHDGVLDVKQQRYYHKFINNLKEGVSYYHTILGQKNQNYFEIAKQKITNDFKDGLQKLDQVLARVNQLAIQ